MTYKAQLKRLVNKKWELIETNEIIGTSIVTFMDRNEDRMVAALFEDDKPRLFLVKTQEDFDKYSEYSADSWCLTLDNFKLLLTDVAGNIPKIYLQTFPDSSFVGIQGELL